MFSIQRMRRNNAFNGLIWFSVCAKHAIGHIVFVKPTFLFCFWFIIVVVVRFEFGAGDTFEQKGYFRYFVCKQMNYCRNGSGKKLNKNK